MRAISSTWYWFSWNQSDMHFCTPGKQLPHCSIIRSTHQLAHYDRRSHGHQEFFQTRTVAEARMAIKPFSSLEGNLRRRTAMATDGPCNHLSPNKLLFDLSVVGLVERYYSFFELPLEECIGWLALFPNGVGFSTRNRHHQDWRLHQSSSLRYNFRITTLSYEPPCPLQAGRLSLLGLVFYFKPIFQVQKQPLTRVITLSSQVA